jgi:DNA-binding response OmpR family regulator
MLLEREGVAVTEAGDGRTALRLLQEDSTEVLLLDLNLPDLDGTEVLRELEGRKPPGLKRVLVLTGDVSGERRQEVGRYGAQLIGKPIDIADLVRLLEATR